jgi:hypothetical protein
MPNEELKGMWRYAMSKNLRKKINRIAMTKMCLKIDPLTAQMTSGCGVDHIRDDCPFCVRNLALSSAHLPDCLAPELDNEFVTMKRAEGIYRPKGVIGCYLLPYCRLGYHRYQNIKAWVRRCHLKKRQ